MRNLRRHRASLVSIVDNWVILTGLIVGVLRDGIGMISIRLVTFSGSDSRSRLPRRKRRGMPDVHLLRDS